MVVAAGTTDHRRKSDSSSNSSGGGGGGGSNVVVVGRKKRRRVPVLIPLLFFVISILLIQQFRETINISLLYNNDNDEANNTTTTTTTASTTTANNTIEDKKTKLNKPTTTTTSEAFNQRQGHLEEETKVLSWVPPKLLWQETILKDTISEDTIYHYGPIKPILHPSGSGLGGKVSEEVDAEGGGSSSSSTCQQERQQPSSSSTTTSQGRRRSRSMVVVTNYTNEMIVGPSNLHQLIEPLVVDDGGGGAREEDLEEKYYATCHIARYIYAANHPHYMQQLYRCFSIWYYYGHHVPRLVTPHKRSAFTRRARSRSFIDGFLRLLPQMGIQVIDTTTQNQGGDQSRQDIMISNKKTTTTTMTETDDEDIAFRTVGPLIGVDDIPYQVISSNDMTRMRDDVIQALGIGNNNHVVVDADGSNPIIMTKQQMPRITILNRQFNRRIANSQELIHDIYEHFNVNASEVFFENPSTFQDQVSAMYTADIVISPHGAQLTVIPFMPDCGVVLELLPNGFYFPQFYGTLASTSSNTLTHAFIYLGNNSQPTYHCCNMTIRNSNLCPSIQLLRNALRDFIRHWHTCVDRIASSASVETGPLSDAWQQQQRHPHHFNGSGNHGNKQPQEEQGAELNRGNRLPPSKAVDKTTEKASPNLPTVDIVSIGSQTRIDYLLAQNSAFGSHSLVRNFLPITEHDEVSQQETGDCSTNLSVNDTRSIIQWCHNAYGRNNNGMTNQDHRRHVSNGASRITWMTKRWIQYFGNDGEYKPGWLCAQQRYMFGLHKMVQSFKAKTLNGNATTTTLALPDYLLVIDDDTYFNLDNLHHRSLSKRHPDEPYVATGCVFQFSKSVVLPYGGFGVIFSKAVLQRLLQPLHCGNYAKKSNDKSRHHGDDGMQSPQSQVMLSFQQLACDRMNQNLIGELSYYKDGMSLIELMMERTKSQSYISHASWTSGWCFHSDHFIEIIIELYYLNVPDLQDVIDGKGDATTNNLGATVKSIASSRLILRRGGNVIKRGQCHNIAEECDPSTSIVCHYQTPERMKELWDNRNNTTNRTQRNEM